MKPLHREIPALIHGAKVLTQSGLFNPLRLDVALRIKRDEAKRGTIVALIHNAAGSIPDSIGLVDDMGALSYFELKQRSDALAATWHRLGINQNSSVAVLCRNNRYLIYGMLAASKLGARLVLTNTGFTSAELHHVFSREGITAVACDEEFARKLQPDGSDIQYFIGLRDAQSPVDQNPIHGPSIDDQIATALGSKPPRVKKAGALVILTSGTSGPAKGAPRQLKSLSATVQFLERLPLRAGQSTFIISPVFHGIGFVHLLLGFGLKSKVVLTNRFEPEKVVETLARESCTAVALVPTILRRIIDLGPEVLGKYDLSKLRIIFSAGSAMPTALAADTQRALGDVLYNMYGSTEVGFVSIATPEELRTHPGTVGRVSPSTDLQLFDDAGKPITEPGVTGRIFANTGVTFSAYTDGQRKEIIEGLTSSGDVGHFDADGLLYVDGRDDEMIISGGENVFPGEVEDLLCSHEAIAEASVIGVPDDDFGQRLAAFVVIRQSRVLDADDVLAHLRGSLARHKIPRDVVFLAKLPRNATGKVLRRDLALPGAGDGTPKKNAGKE